MVERKGEDEAGSTGTFLACFPLPAPEEKHRSSMMAASLVSLVSCGRGKHTNESYQEGKSRRNHTALLVLKRNSNCWAVKATGSTKGMLSSL